MSELLTKDFIFLWAGIVSVSFVIWIILTAKELNDIVDKRSKK
tara:strand:- start:186 stop:314 length:129 start_codon:yes stop_codon:yes gene_type:complete